MINWISTSDDSQKPEIWKPVFIRGTGHKVDVVFVIAYVLYSTSSDDLRRTWNWAPCAFDLGYGGDCHFGTVTHWAEIPEGLFNEPTA